MKETGRSLDQNQIVRALLFVRTWGPERLILIPCISLVLLHLEPLHLDMCR